MARRQIYLVPGFFGFARLGAVSYFEGVAEALERALTDLGVDARVVECRTQPTSSLTRRASCLVDMVEETGGLDAEELHFIGHSTGGLDIRLLTTPGLRLRSDSLEPRIVERTRSVVTVATPHYGTPLAGFFTTLPGRQLLELLALFATSRGGRLGLAAAAQVLTLAARADDFLGRRETFLDFLARSFLERMTHTKDDPFWHYLREIASDQGAVIQLTPEAMHLFNAAVTDSAAIRYSSLLTVAPPPPSGYRPDDLLSLARAALAGTFTFLHTLSTFEHRHYPYPHPGPGVLQSLRRKIPFRLSAASNDGVVPTYSQVYGRVLDVLVADHLDVVGQFRREDDPHSDWLPSGSRFDERRFEQAWKLVAREIAEASQAAGCREAAEQRAREQRAGTARARGHWRDDTRGAR